MIRKIVCSAVVILMVVGLFAGSAFAYKPRVTVYGFESKASSGIWHSAKWDIGTGMGEMLIDALTNTGRFEVVERLNLSDIITEQDLVSGGRVSKKTGARTGELKGAEYIVRGTITEFDYKESSGGLGLKIKGFTLGAKTSQAHIAGIIRIYDATTGEVLSSKRVVKTVPATGLTLGYSDDGIGGSIGGFKKTPLGEATHMAIKEMVDFVSAKIPSEPRVVKTNCHKCGAEVAVNEKFCPKCGVDMSIRVPDECPKCATEISPGMKFCPKCGTQLADISCPGCGKKLPAGTNFCPYCGGKVKK